MSNAFIRFATFGKLWKDFVLPSSFFFSIFEMFINLWIKF